MKNDKYMLIALGTEETETKIYDSMDEAIEELKNRANNYVNECGYDMIITNNDNAFEASCEYKYQSCFIVVAPSSVQEEIMIELLKAKCGLTQYAFELTDTDVCEQYINSAMDSLLKLK